MGFMVKNPVWVGFQRNWSVVRISFLEVVLRVGNGQHHDGADSDDADRCAKRDSEAFRAPVEQTGDENGGECGRRDEAGKGEIIEEGGGALSRKGFWLGCHANGLLGFWHLKMSGGFSD